MNRMEQSDIPLVLSFRYAKVQDFEIYEGSRKGAVKCEVADRKPSDFWVDEIREKENLYKEMQVVFLNDYRLKIFPYGYLFSYRQRNGAIEVFVTDTGKWEPFAYGGYDKLRMKLGLTCVANDWGIGKKRSLNCDETSWGAFNYAGMHTYSLLKNSKTKVAWCNIHYVFQ